MSAATTFYRKLTQIHPTIAVLSPYVDSRSTPMRFRCEVCDHEWHNKPGQVVAQRKAGCPKCTVKRVLEAALATKAAAQEKRVASWLKGSTTRILGRVDSVTFKLKCVKCRRQWDAHINSIRQYVRAGCKSCVSSEVGLEHQHRTAQRILKRDARFADIQLTKRNEVECKCATCGGSWTTSIGSIKKGSACPACGIRQALASPKRAPKTFKIHGRTFKCTGYEPQAIEYLIKSRKVPARLISTEVPVFQYRYANADCKYTPDLIVDGRYVIEVKSELTFGCLGSMFGVNVLTKNKAKARAVERAGYEFRMIVVRVTGRAKDKVSVMTLPVGWQNTPAKELRRLVVSELDNI